MSLIKAKDYVAFNDDRLEAENAQDPVSAFARSYSVRSPDTRAAARDISGAPGFAVEAGYAPPEDETRVTGPGRSARRGQSCAHLLHLRDSRPHWEQAPRRLQPVPTPTSCPHHAAASVSDTSFSHILSTLGPVSSAFQPLLTCGQPHTVKHPSSRLGSHSGHLTGQWPCCHSCSSLQPSILSIQECTIKMSMSLPWSKPSKTFDKLRVHPPQLPGTPHPHLLPHSATAEITQGAKVRSNKVL